MAFAKTQKQAIYRVGLKHTLRKNGFTNFKASASTKRLEKLVEEKVGE